MLPDLRVGRMARTPLPLSAARTRPGGSREAARRPDGTTSMGRARVPGHGLGDRWQRTRSRGGKPAASVGGMSRDTEETAGSPTKRSGKSISNRRQVLVPQPSSTDGQRSWLHDFSRVELDPNGGEPADCTDSPNFASALNCSPIMGSVRRCAVVDREHPATHRPRG